MYQHHATHENAALETPAPPPPPQKAPTPPPSEPSNSFNLKDENEQLSQQVFLLSEQISVLTPFFIR